MIAENKFARRAGHYGYYGVTFQNGAKQPLCMLDAVAFQNGEDLEPIKRQPFIYLERGKGSPTTPFGGVSFVDEQNKSSITRSLETFTSYLTRELESRN